MDLVACQQLNAFQIARTQVQVVIFLAALSTSSVVPLAFSLSSVLRNSLVLAACSSKFSTTNSLPSASFAASAERNAPSSFLRGKE